MVKNQILRGVAVLSAVTGAAGLTGCDKPTPLATVRVGGTTWTTSAATYRPHASIDPTSDCSSSKNTPTVKLSSGDSLGIGVEAALADAGWIYAVNLQGIGQSTKTYTTIDPATLQQALTSGSSAIGSDAELQIVEKGKNRREYKGCWVFKLTVKS